jgi:hypothetical protein
MKSLLLRRPREWPPFMVRHENIESKSRASIDNACAAMPRTFCLGMIYSENR